MRQETTPPCMLVIGAAEESLGEAVYLEAQNWDFAAVNTAGISGEQVKLDVTHSARIGEVLAQVRPDIVVCTVGVNTPAPVQDPYLPMKLSDAFNVNVTGPMEVLRHFITSQVRPERDGMVKKFVAVSSNSARIPRRASMAYCASKAALSMALRVAARELAGSPVQVWGYEPGLLAGTPMTRQVATELQDKLDNGSEAVFRLHRMKGVGRNGIPVSDLAYRIVSDVAGFSVANNGVMFPFDADEV